MRTLRTRSLLLQGTDWLSLGGELGTATGAHRAPSWWQRCSSSKEIFDLGFQPHILLLLDPLACFAGEQQSFWNLGAAARPP